MNTGLHDFDFFHGRWSVANRRLKQRHVASNDWDEFPAEDTCRGMLGGVANVGEIVFPTKGWSGLTVRLFDTAKHIWSIYWINSRNGVLTPPVHGRFENGRGLFYGDDDDDGRPVKVAFRWQAHPRTPYWEQAFSTDDGKTWETNWTMQMTRIGNAD